MSKGQSIFELIVALGIAALVVVALMRVATLSLSNINFSKTNSQATRYAEEAMEWLRQKRDENWDIFYDEASKVPGRPRCLNSFPADLEDIQTSDCGASQKIGSTQFSREVTLTPVPPSQVNVITTVSWTEGTNTHQVKLDSLFTDWRKQQ